MGSLFHHSINGERSSLMLGNKPFDRQARHLPQRLFNIFPGRGNRRQVPPVSDVTLEQRVLKQTLVGADASFTEDRARLVFDGVRKVHDHERCEFEVRKRCRRVMKRHSRDHRRRKPPQSEQVGTNLGVIDAEDAPFREVHGLPFGAGDLDRLGKFIREVRREKHLPGAEFLADLEVAVAKSKPAAAGR